LGGETGTVGRIYAARLRHAYHLSKDTSGVDDPSMPKERRPKLALVYSGDLLSMEEKDPKGIRPPTNPLEKLDLVVGDSLLIALRGVVSATYARETSLVALEKTLGEIRRLAIDGLRGMGGMLATLRLKRLGPGELPDDESPKVHKFSLVRTRDLPRRLRVEGEAKARPFFEIIKWADGGPPLTALRKILSLTFGELVTRKAQVKAIWEIRKLAAETLAPVNDWLEEIDLEPVAMPTRQYDEDDWEDDPEHPQCLEER